MEWQHIHNLLIITQHTISLLGILIIISGIVLALYQYVSNFFIGDVESQVASINAIRLTLGRVLILGLEFIVAADLIGTTTTPDYYAVGLLAIIVVIRTVLSFSINRELMNIAKE